MDPDNGVRLVLDDGAGKGPFVGEVVVNLRRAHVRRGLDVFGARPGDPTGVHQGGGGGHDPVPGGTPFRGDHPSSLPILELTFQKVSGFVE